MCKLFPGPRCASHTYDAFQSAMTRRKSVYETAEMAGAQFDKVMLDPESSHEAKMQARSLLGQALDALEKADERLLDARDHYDSTPTGQKRLRDAIEASTDEAEKASLESRLKFAEQTRNAEMEALRLQRNADKNLKALSDDDAATLASLNEEVDKHAVLEEEERAKLNEAAIKARRARSAKDASLVDMRYAQTGVESVNKEAHAYLVEAYVNAGVSKKNAIHYASDTIAANQNGWQFIGPEEDTSERTARYHDRGYEVKTKGEGHADYEATERARVALQDDEKFQELSARVQFAQRTYQRSFTAAYNARHEFHAEEGRMRQSAEQYQEKRAALREAETNANRFRAMRASKIDTVQSHRVTPKAFVASAYSNPDGSTNAYVLVNYGETSSPYYAQVTSMGREKDGRGYVTLNNGTRIYASDISNHDLVVVKPQEGADKLFDGK